MKGLQLEVNVGMSHWKVVNGWRGWKATEDLEVPLVQAKNTSMF